jgi:uncharacterized membrane-anchored protein YhcB (DUF1043 family)
MDNVVIFYFLVSIAAAFMIAEMGKARKIGYWGAFFVSLLLSPILGIIIVSFSGKETYESPRFQDSIELAKKEEFKGNILIAIDKYQDALYYLKNDYPQLNPKLLASHQTLINNIQSKIEELKKIKFIDAKTTL